MSNSRISTRVDDRGDVTTRTVNQPSGLIVEIESSRFGREGTEVTLGFEGSENRNLKLDGRQARAIYLALEKHYSQLA